MKKILLLLPLALAACDRPTSTTDLTCSVDKYWQRSNALYLNNAYYDPAARDDVDVNVTVTTYDDYAKVTVNGITTTFEKVSERRDNGEFGYIGLIYKGNFPSSERTALLDIYADITNKQILQYQLNFIGQKTKNEFSGRETSISRVCHPIKEEYKGKSWGSAVPFHHNYKMPNKIEQCITDICKIVYCGNEECTKLVILNDNNGKQTPLSPSDALSLSKNWNYSDMKFYRNDGKLEAHEKDACEVLDRLNKFIADNDLFFDAYTSIQNAMDNCDNGCPIIIHGEMGDYLIQLPETEDLRKIANKQKDSKFLSVFNPNSYTKDGYCLVNVIPYNTMKELGTPDSNCNYRIYCGAPEHMDYDEFYAVEVCR
ncbi:MAG: hypothetical protein IJL21_04705 [Alphaproteobacteria bacterium]|nr:hypothetical protein [Alphaproteobacteria bacterium]